MKDDLLEEGVALFSTNNKTCWERTAKLIGHGMNYTQCRQRWQRYLKDKELFSKDSEEWTDSEVFAAARLHLMSNYIAN